MQIVDNLGQALLCLILARNVGEFDAVGRLDIDFGIAPAHVEHHGVLPAGFFHDQPGNELTDQEEDGNRQHPVEKELGEYRRLFHDLAGKLRAGFVKTVGSVRVVHHAGLVDLLLVFVGKGNQIFGFRNLHQSHVALFGHGDEGAVVHLFDPVCQNVRNDHHIHQEHQRQNHAVKNQKCLFRFFDFIHMQSPLVVSNGNARSKVPKVFARLFPRGGAVEDA
ncbi:unknown [Clostridium sp. CAG:448]|nr:unknown [Clostridium sp. CAG:448]